MKRALATITAVALVLIATSAMAGRVKVPKTLCLYNVSWPSQYQKLTFKATGKIPDPVAGKVTTYAVTGHAYQGIAHAPVSGSAYVVPGTTTLHATFGGMYASDRVSHYEVVYDLANDTGSLNNRFDYSNGTDVITGTTAIYSTDCDALSMPAAVPDAGQCADMDFKENSIQ